jgi:MFS family permease
MLTVAFLAMFLMTTVYGKWIDSNGNKYTMPYITSFVFGITSYTIYFLAVLIPPGPIAVYTLMFSRFLEGMSVAGRTLSYSWVHSMIPHDKQKTVLTILSMSRTIGSIVGPITNLLVSEINTEWHIFDVTIPVNPNNSIGLLMVGSEVVLLILTLIFLLEPPDKKDDEDAVLKEKDKDKKEDGEKTGLLYVLGHFELWYVSYKVNSIH